MLSVEGDVGPRGLAVVADAAEVRALLPSADAADAAFEICSAMAAARAFSIARASVSLDLSASTFAALIGAAGGLAARLDRAAWSCPVEGSMYA